MIRIVFIVLLTLLAGGAYTQNLSNKGKDFWVGYGHHQFMEPGQGNSQEMVIYLSAEQPANVTVTIEGSGVSAGQPPWTRSYSIAANTVISTEPIPKGGWYDARLYTCPPGFGLPQCTGGEGVFTAKGIHITSDVPIVAYAHIYGSASSGATMLMPVETWGFFYTSINSRQEYQPNCYSWMYVIAERNNTTVEITPSVPTRNGRPAGVPFTVTLNRGEIYQVVGANPTGGSAALELSGTTVRSIANASGVCYPVAAFAGSSRTWNTISCGAGSGGDNDNQQMFPYQAWGKRFLTAPTSSNRNLQTNMTNSFKIAVKDPTTKVLRNGTLLTGAVNNVYFFESSQTEYIEADKPIMVGQFMTGGACLAGGDGDPEMMYISPMEQAIKHIGFFRNNQESINANLLTLIVPNGGTGLSSLRIDGLPLASIPAGSVYTYVHPRNAAYNVVVRRWTTALPPAPPPGQCIVDGDSAFTAITYGLGVVESYGYNAGTFINNLNVIGAIHNTLDTSSATNDFTCVNAPVELSMLIAYKPTQLVWQLSTLTGVLTPAADITMNNPVPTDSVVVKGVPYYKYTLPQTYYFNTADTFDVPVQATHPSIENCNHTEVVKFIVIVKGKPRADFTFEHTGCALDTVYFTGPDTTAESYSIDRWKWSFPGPVLDSGQFVKRILPVGNHNITLTTISDDGCVSDSTRPITILAPPVAAITAAPAAVCEGASIAFKDNSIYGGAAPFKGFYWDWGNTKIDTVSADSTHHIKYATAGSYTVKHVVKVSALCISDTALQTVTVYAKPNLSFNYPAGCLPTNGIVQFQSTTTAPDGQAINSYSWNFGDPGATPANPNTSTLADPVHTYSFGNYTIQYSATTANGCTKDTSVAASFNIRPALTYGALTARCANITTPVSVASAAVTNGVAGTGVYSGPGTSASGTFNPSLAGAGTHTITYTFTSTGGCVETISSSITVYPKPVAAFTANANVCLDQAVTFTDASTVATGAITSWKWDFADGNTATNTNGNAFTRNYTAFGNYTVKLVAVSDRGCSSDTVSHLVAVHPLPVTDFSLPAAVCMPGGTASFTNSTTVADNSGLTYVWNFGDGSAVSNAQNATHVYASKGSYNVVLTTTSGHGCVNATTKQLRNFFDKPVAQFDVAPDTLCQGADNVFTDQSTSVNSNIDHWTWDFGDGTSSDKQNPVKRYSAPGKYIVKLKVTNTAGCESNEFTKQVTVFLQPVIDAGPSYVVPQGTQVIFNPKANDSAVTSFYWSPGGALSSASSLRPTLMALINETYTLTATGEGNCTASDFITVKILKPVNIPNAFSPNGDGIHDTWEIPNLVDYPGATVEVFNRYGQKLFYSSGYAYPWDGKVNGTVLPVATYYYVIHLKNGFAPLTGSVTIVK